MKKIQLTQGKFALVDDSDYEWLNQWKWCYSHGYAQTRGRGNKEYMHRVIMNPPSDKQVDHRSKALEGLDNRRSNLRIGTSSDNQHNRSTNRNNTSGYKCISWSKQRRKWEISVMSGWIKYRRYTSNITEAVKIRDALLKELHGDFVRIENAK